MNEEAEEAARTLREQTEAACACRKAEARQAVDDMVQQMERMREDCRGAMEVLSRYKARAAESPAAGEETPAESPQGGQKEHDDVMDKLLSSLRGKNSRA